MRRWSSPRAACATVALAAAVMLSGCGPNAEESREVLVACHSYAGHVLGVAFGSRLPPGFELALARELKLPPEEVGHRIQRDLLLGAAAYPGMIEPVRAQRAREAGEAAARRHLEAEDARAAAGYYEGCFRAADRLAR
jgi:hypothetical protein